MVDDKDGSAPDPWAGIDDDAATPAADGFTFSFDSSSEVVEENPFADVGEAPAEPAVPDPVPDVAADMVPGAVADMVADAPEPEPSPILPLDAAAGSELDADPFASLSVDAAGGEDEDISAWLEEPDASAPSDPPLAVFPPPGAEPPQPEAPATDFLADGPDFGEVPAEDLHAFGEAPEPPAGASRVEIGTGKSGIVSPSDVDPLSDAAASSDIVAFGGMEDSSDVAPASGIVPVDDWADQVSADAALDTSLESFAVDEQPSFDASGFDGLSESGVAGVEGESPVGGGLEAIAAVGAAAAPVAAAAKAPVRKKGGGIGQLVGIVLGGLMAIPITYAILIWGFQRDPFKVTAMVPEQVAFLLPQKFQPGFKKPSGGPKLDAASALDDLATVTPEPQAAEPTSDPEPAGGKPETPATEPPLAADGTPAAAPPMKEQPGAAEPAPAVPLPAPFEDLAAATKSPPVPAPPPPPPEPEPLDLSALESAVGEATAAFDELRAVDAEAPERRKLLVEWYKKLAAVAEQCVLLEKVATDSGRTLEGATTCIDELCATLALEPAVQADLAKLGGMWLASKKRPADGTVLLGTFEGSRQVGPYWSTKVTIDGSEPRTVAVVSRIEPRAQPGESVLVTGVVFDGDFVWATDCRPLAKKAARVEDLF